jgi:hypothetical protein
LDARATDLVAMDLVQSISDHLDAGAFAMRTFREMTTPGTSTW